MFLILIFLISILLIGICFYYYKLLKRFISVFKINISKKRKNLFVFLSIILCLLSINLFTSFGLFLMHFIVISLLIDLIYLLLKKYLKNSKVVFIYKISIIPLIIVLIIFGYGFVNIRNIVETKYTIYTNKDIGSDLKILFIADSHYGDIFKKSKLDSIKERFDKVDADIVVLGGDIVDEATTKEEMQYVFRMFGSIQNKFGIYYVYGNHDRQLYSVNKYYTEEDLNKVLNNNNIKILKDDYYEINDNIIIAGREDYSVGREKLENVLNSLSSDDYKIVVDHQPLNYDENINNGVDLILSGHTHAGQIFPVEMFIKLFHTADLSYGYKSYEGMNAVVTSGLVGWGYPIRTSHHSEYVIIDIKMK